MRVRRTPAAVCAVLPLLLAATACSDSSGGLVTGNRGLSFEQSIANPVQGKGECHEFASGVSHVVNNTDVDIWLHKGPNCTDPQGAPSLYLPEGLSAKTDGTPGLWQGFTTVGWPPPVPVNSPSPSAGDQPRSY